MTAPYRYVPRVSVLCFWLLLVLAAYHALGALAIGAKARLAPILIDRAWDASLRAGGSPVRPWPWADTWPVARLDFPDFGKRFPVLFGDSGNALAFAPGQSSHYQTGGVAAPRVIGGHRDTHFALLRDIAIGASLRLQGADGRWTAYEVRKTRIVDSRTATPLDIEATDDEIILVTCYPFDALSADGPLRFIVIATPV